MVKRTNVQAAKHANKKAKIDPALENIANIINEAEHLPQQCRAMLVDMLPLSLSVTVDKRHELQTVAVDMVEETLNTKMSAMEAAVAAENEKLETLKASEGGLTNAVQVAETALTAQQVVVQKLKEALAEATSVANASQTTLSERTAAQKAGDEAAVAAKEEKAALEVAFDAHFKTPMTEGTAGPNFKELEPFLKTIEIEASLLTALPSSCAKSKEHRGTFDEVVLTELDKAISSKLASLGALLAAEAPASIEREAAVRAAEKEYEAKKEAQRQSAAAFESAQRDLGEREAKLTEAKSHVDEFQPQLTSLLGSVEKVKVALGEFEAGPFATFTTFKTKTGVAVEVAPAGA